MFLETAQAGFGLDPPASTSQVLGSHLLALFMFLQCTKSCERLTPRAAEKTIYEIIKDESTSLLTGQFNNEELFWHFSVF
jgi:hypothetical protein